MLQARVQVMSIKFTARVLLCENKKSEKGTIVNRKAKLKVTSDQSILQ